MRHPHGILPNGQVLMDVVMVLVALMTLAALIFLVVDPERRWPRGGGPGQT